MRILLVAVAAFAASALIGAHARDGGTPTEAPAADSPATDDGALSDEERWRADFLARLEPRVGEVKIEAAKATLNVPEDYYFLGAADARAVLEEAWGNPPDESTLGMLFPKGMTPFDGGAWTAVFSYEEDGYVSDKDASKIDYDDLLKQMRKDAVASNEWRAENGYVPIEIVGWAEPPGYNAETHKLYWAKELKFGEAEKNTLNYDIRVLGRKGVLVIGFIADIDSLPGIRAAAPAVLDMASFDEGARYADYEKGVDKVAAYGLAGLIAGGAIAKKTGLLAAIAVFGKKFIVLILAGLAGAGAWLRRMFSKKS